MALIKIEKKIHGVIETGSFMPGVAPTTPYGTDCTTMEYFAPLRLHIAKDRGRGEINAPFSCWVRFYDIRNDSSYGTITQLISDGADVPLGFSLAIMHCNAAPKKEHYFMNELITHTGNVGLGTREHAHYELWYDKGIKRFENIMTECFYNNANNDDKFHFAHHAGISICKNSSANDAWHMYSQAENADLNQSRAEIHKKYLSEIHERSILFFNNIYAIVYDRHVYKKNIIKCNPEIMEL